MSHQPINSLAYNTFDKLILKSINKWKLMNSTHLSATQTLFRK